MDENFVDIYDQMAAGDFINISTNNLIAAIPWLTALSDMRLIKPYLSFDAVETKQRSLFTRGQHFDALRGELTAYTGTKRSVLGSFYNDGTVHGMKFLDDKEVMK